MKLHRHLVAALSGIALLAAAPAQAEERYITVASTTSTEQSGLFKHLLPLFEKDSRHQGPRHRPGHRPGTGHRPARRCRRALRA